MKVALYARYSSDDQRDASIADQIRVCRLFADREGWLIDDEFHEHAISGATLLRPGFQALMRRARAREFDIVLAESLDRFSRDQEDTAGLFKRLTFRRAYLHVSRRRDHAPACRFQGNNERIVPEGSRR